MINLNNPAARLLHVLRRLGAADGDTPARRAWANALDVDPDDLLGGAPLRRAVDAAVGSLLTDPRRRAETTRTKLGERCWKVIARAAALLAAGQPMPELAGPVRQLLPAAFKTVRRRGSARRS